MYEKKTVAFLKTAIFLSATKNTLIAGYFPPLLAIIYIPAECYGKKGKQ